jgi:hypothetical protein
MGPVGRGALGVLLAGGLAAGTGAAAAPKITLSPAAGVYAATQVVDIVVIVEGLEGAEILGAQAELDTVDVTEPLLGCPTSTIALRCDSI